MDAEANWTKWGAAVYQAAGLTLVGIGQHQIIPIMPIVAPMLEPAVARSDGHWAIWDVAAALASGSMHLWLALDGDEPVAACTTAVVTYPRARVLQIVFMGGRHLDRMLELLPFFEDHARVMQCAQVEEWGRPGWQGVLKAAGWRVGKIVMTKDL